MKEFVRPERRMLVTLTSAYHWLWDLMSFSLHLCQLVSSLWGEKAVWCEIRGVDLTAKQVSEMWTISPGSENQPQEANCQSLAYSCNMALSFIFRGRWYFPLFKWVFLINAFALSKGHPLGFVLSTDKFYSAHGKLWRNKQHFAASIQGTGWVCLG